MGKTKTETRQSGEFKQVQRKLVVVGDGMCGKTCLLLVFKEKEFPETYVPTVIETYMTDIQVGNVHVDLTLWDTTGQEDFDRLRPLSYPETDVFLMCFSLDTPSSFHNISSKWIPEIRHFCPNVPIVLVGTKKDLRPSRDICQQINKEKYKYIQHEDGKILADKIKAFSYMESSAKSGEGVREVFDSATKATLLQQKRARHRSCQLL